MVVETLSILIQNYTNIQGLKVCGSEFIINQLADDTTVFIKNERQIH